MCQSSCQAPQWHSLRKEYLIHGESRMATFHVINMLKPSFVLRCRLMQTCFCFIVSRTAPHGGISYCQALRTPSLRSFGWCNLTCNLRRERQYACMHSRNDSCRLKLGNKFTDKFENMKIMFISNLQGE